MSVHSGIAKDLFNKGYNCSQAVFAAFCDETNLKLETALSISSSFGGGMGRLREVCGAVSGMFMVVGMKYGSYSPIDKGAKAEHYKLIQSLATKFKEENNSIICRELLDGTKKHSCLELVEQAAIILDEYIQNRKHEESQKI